jgi:hypothetical protein
MERLLVFHRDAYLSPRCHVFRTIGPCLECFGVPDGSIAHVDFSRAPQIGDFALLEMSEAHEIADVKLAIKKLGMRQVLSAGQLTDVVTLEWVGPSVLLGDEQILGTVVAFSIPSDAGRDELGVAMSNHIDRQIAAANQRGVKCSRKPPHHA